MEGTKQTQPQLPLQQHRRRRQVPYWIPQDIYLPSSSSRSSVTTSSISHNDSGSSSSNFMQDDHDDDNDKQSASSAVQEDAASSVWSLSTTSELTFHSLSGGNQTQTLPATQVQLAVEATYLDLEEGANVFGPSFLAEDKVALVQTMPVVMNESHESCLQDDGGGEDEYEHEPLFDPFGAPTEDATLAFAEFYHSAEVSADHHDENCSLNLHESAQSTSDTQGDSLLINRFDPSVDDDELSANEKSCSRSLKRLDKQQRRHSDLGISNNAASSGTRRKRRVLIPLHARMEMITHQSQKPFRTVSKMITGSIHRLHDRMTRPMTPKRIASCAAPPRQRFEIFRRNSERVVTGDYQYEDSSVSSMPDLRNVDSSETDATPPPMHLENTGLVEDREVIAQFVLASNDQDQDAVATSRMPLRNTPSSSWDEGEGQQQEEVIAQFVVHETPERKTKESTPPPLEMKASSSRDEEGEQQLQDIAKLFMEEEPRAKVAAEPEYDGDKLGEQLVTPCLIDEKLRATVNITPSSSRDEDEDLRWLFARQQIPASGSFEREEECTQASI